MLGTAPAEGREEAPQRAVGQRHRVRGQPGPRRRHRCATWCPRQRAERARATTVRRIEITSSTTTAPRRLRRADQGPDGTPQRSGCPDPNLRPAVVGVFTDLTGPAPQGFSLSADIDARFTPKPTPPKLAAIVLAILSTVIAVLALWRLDRVDGRRMHRLIDPLETVTAVTCSWWACFVLWYIIGTNSSDDGYQLQMARTAEHSGYMANYFRWLAYPRTRSAGTTTCWR